MRRVRAAVVAFVIRIAETGADAVLERVVAAVLIGIANTYTDIIGGSARERAMPAARTVPAHPVRIRRHPLMAIVARTRVEAVLATMVRTGLLTASVRALQVSLSDLIGGASISWIDLAIIPALRASRTSRLIGSAAWLIDVACDQPIVAHQPVGALHVKALAYLLPVTTAAPVPTGARTRSAASVQDTTGIRIADVGCACRLPMAAATAVGTAVVVGAGALAAVASGSIGSSAALRLACAAASGIGIRICLVGNASAPADHIIIFNAGCILWSAIISVVILVATGLVQAAASAVARSLLLALARRPALRITILRACLVAGIASGSVRRQRTSRLRMATARGIGIRVHRSGMAYGVLA